MPGGHLFEPKGQSDNPIPYSNLKRGRLDARHTLALLNHTSKMEALHAFRASASDKISRLHCVARKYPLERDMKWKAIVEEDEVTADSGPQLGNKSFYHFLPHLMTFGVGLSDSPSSDAIT